MELKQKENTKNNMEQIKQNEADSLTKIIFKRNYRFYLCSTTVGNPLSWLAYLFRN